MSWKEDALKALNQKVSAAYDDYYRSKSALGENHPTTVGYKKWYEDAKKSLEEAKAELSR